MGEDENLELKLWFDDVTRNKALSAVLVGSKIDLSDRGPSWVGHCDCVSTTRLQVCFTRTSASVIWASCTRGTHTNVSGVPKSYPEMEMEPETVRQIQLLVINFLIIAVLCLVCYVFFETFFF
ncbi:Hypp7818 [Branchiostoma lanceolatum]|uniref:Hypp7818 protein n=1 Tax=Branchiostoma lanceolatum TaxID=7740 RepID=A0A8J9Z3T7_BRALA|nr:Hypp7818 [Branchiostoma lanceolatum]